MGSHQILTLLFFLFFLHSCLPFASPLCPLDQRDALLHFKSSFVLKMNWLPSCFWCPPSVDPRKGSSWSKSVDCCLWNRITCDSDSGNVIGLDLSSSLFHNALYFNSSLLLPELQVLTMSSCNLTKFPYFLNSLEGLTHLDLSSNKINGEIPRWFWGISNDTLDHLYLSDNLLEGGIQQLHRKQFSTIDLQRNNFQGPLPIPSPFTSYFDASYNGFTGEIPSSLCQLRSLKYLDLSNNNLSGNMILCFGNINSETSEDLCHILKGRRAEIRMKPMSYIDLSNNSFQGPLPIPSPYTCSFYANNNDFSGEIPSSICRLSSLMQLKLSNNNLSGNIPPCLGNMTNLVYLDLRSNKLQGEIPSLPLNSLSYLFISNNNFTGRWSTKVFSHTSLSVIDLSNNKFGGPIPLPSPVTMYYSIASNNIIGKIPYLICNATNLEMIDLSDNSLTGSLPWCLTNFSTDLSILNLRMNQLEGTIPQSFSSKNSLATLDLSQNRFEGTLSRSLVNCTNLEILDLSSNHIEDMFPRWLGKLPELKVLILRSNNFKGLLNIPKGDRIFHKLHILDLSNNYFCGPLLANLIMNLEGMMDRKDGQDEPLYMTESSYMGLYENTVTVMIKGQETKLVKILTIFTTIDLSHNSFQGNIPGVIGHLHSLIGLNLSHNHLIGSIPLTLGSLTNLGWLDLSSNMLSGVIPRKLGDLASLGYLNLSKNQLTGQIPQDKQLSTFSSDSFSGNPGLCGTPLPKSCPGDAQPPPPSPQSTFDHEVHESWFKNKVIWLGYASGIVIGISIAYIAFEMGRPKWLMQVVRMLERRAAKWMEKSKGKAIKFHGR